MYSAAMSHRDITRTLYLLTKSWTKTPDNDDVAGEIGVSPEEADRLWFAIWQARAAHADDYLTAVRHPSRLLVSFPDGSQATVRKVTLGWDPEVPEGTSPEVRNFLLDVTNGTWTTLADKTPVVADP